MTQSKPAAYSAWSDLHDLALIYLALAHGTDAHIDPLEARTMFVKLQAWIPQADASRIEKVMEEVMLVYVGEASRGMVNAAIASLRDTLPPQRRMAVLADLADLASSDGMIVPGEISFIQEIARQWEVDRNAN